MNTANTLVTEPSLHVQSIRIGLVFLQLIIYIKDKNQLQYPITSYGYEPDEPKKMLLSLQGTKILLEFFTCVHILHPTKSDGFN